MTYTRKQYMNKEVSHREYHAQFVTASIIETVKQRVGVDKIMASTDEHLNDIPLAKWDAITGYSHYRNTPVTNTLGVANKIREAGDCVNAATLVCILKEAAKQIKEGTAK